MKFLITMERDEAGYYVAECPTLPGCVSQGRTEAEATVNIKSAIEDASKPGESLACHCLLRKLIRLTGLTVEEFTALL